MLNEKMAFDLIASLNDGRGKQYIAEGILAFFVWVAIRVASDRLYLKGE